MTPALPLAATPPALPATESWANGFWILCGLFLLLRVWRGWQDGLGRQLLAAGALVGAYLAGVYGGPALGPEVGKYLAAPDFVLNAIAGVGVGIVVLCLINAAGRTLVPRTRDRPPGLGRLLWAGGGALVAVGINLVSLWVIFIGARLAGSVAEGRLQVEAAKRPLPASPAAVGNRRPAPALAAESPAPEPPTPPAPDPSLGGTLRGLAAVKNTLDRGVLGEVLAAVDPVPPVAYAVLNKLARVVSDPVAMDRFRNHFMVRQLGMDPKIAALLDDPAVSRELAAKNYHALLGNPRVLAAANDPQIARRLRAFDLNRALDEALEK